MTELRSPFKPGFGDDEAVELAARLKALADPTRLKILALLRSSGTMSVVELTAVLPLTQPTVSHHLIVLGAAGLVTTHESGVWKHRSLAFPAMRELSRLLDPGWPS